jgi:hypothetical protein
MSPQRLLAAYEEGQITAIHCIGRFCSFAVEVDPATFARLLPEDWLAEIRDRTIRIPRPEELIVVSPVCNSTPIDPVEWANRNRLETERTVAGLQAWKAYFDKSA